MQRFIFHPNPRRYLAQARIILHDRGQSSSMLKYAGVLLTKEHIFKLASSILQENLDDIHDMNTFLRAYMTVWRVLTRNRPKYFIHPMSMPRRSPKSEHSRFLLVCRVYKDPYETRMNYVKMPATEMDANILDWLKENGMESQEILDQWTTIPNPAYDV